MQAGWCPADTVHRMASRNCKQPGCTVVPRLVRNRGFCAQHVPGPAPSAQLAAPEPEPGTSQLTIGRGSYTLSSYTSADGAPGFMLTGRRGAWYFLRPWSRRATGHFQAAAWSTGKELCDARGGRGLSGAAHPAILVRDGGTLRVVDSADEWLGRGRLLGNNPAFAPALALLESYDAAGDRDAAVMLLAMHRTFPGTVEELAATIAAIRAPASS